MSYPCESEQNAYLLGCDKLPGGLQCVSSNGTVCVEFCPKGYYCPAEKGVVKKCSSGHFCQLGSEDQMMCTFGEVSCPREKMDHELEMMLFATLVIIIGILCVSYYVISKTRMTRSVLKFDKVALEAADELFREKAEQSILVEVIDLLQNSHHLCPPESPGGCHLRNNHRRLRGSEIPDDYESDNSVSSVSTTRSGRSKLRNIIKSKEFEDYMNKSKRRITRGTSKIEQSFSLRHVQNPLTFSFTDMSLTTKTSPRKKILNNLFGVVYPFNVTAIVGTSGCGKTTFLNLLRGEASYADVEGSLHVNSIPVPDLSAFRSSVAFVPQDDVMYLELTVEECIMYAALLFNTRGLSTVRQCTPMVSYILHTLGLDFIRHFIVGSPDKKSISGGQRKRVSVGMELVKEGSVVILDEPTSGLDSASSMSLMYTLQDLAAHGANVVATLHQPRHEILDMINCIIVLGPGGKLVYHGSTIGLETHLQQMKFTPPPRVNIVDFTMDVLSGFVIKDSRNEVTSVDRIVRYLEKWWRKHKVTEHMEYCSNEKMSIHAFYQRMKILRRHVSRDNVEDIPVEQDILMLEPKSVLQVTKVAMRRQFNIYDREFSSLFPTLLGLYLIGTIMVILFGNMELTITGSPDIGPVIQCMHLAFSLFVTSRTVSWYVRDEKIRNRELSGGVSLLGLYVGKIIGNVGDMFYLPLAFVCGSYPYVKSRCGFGSYWGSFLLLYLAISGTAHLIASVFGTQHSSVVGTGAVVVFWSIGGLNPKVDTIEQNLGVIGLFLNIISPFKWSFERQFLAEVTTYSEAWDPIVENVYDTYKYKESDLLLCTLVLCAYWLVTNSLAFLTLAIRRDDFKIWRDLKAYIGDYLPESGLPRDLSGILSSTDENEKSLSSELGDTKKSQKRFSTKSDYNKVVSESRLKTMELTQIDVDV